jgi:hypothetical protein
MNLIDSLLKKNKAKHNAPCYLILLSFLKNKLNVFTNIDLLVLGFIFFLKEDDILVREGTGLFQFILNYLNIILKTK